MVLPMLMNMDAAAGDTFLLADGNEMKGFQQCP